jgi:hypothetical protein
MQIHHLSLNIPEETSRQASYQDMIRSEAPVQNSAPVDVSQGLQDSLGVLHQGGQGRPLVLVAHTASLAPYLLPVATTRTMSVPAQLSQSQSARGQLECSFLCKRR